MSEQAEPKCECGRNVPGQFSQRPIPVDPSQPLKLDDSITMEIAIHRNTKCSSTTVAREWWAKFMEEVFFPAMNARMQGEQMAASLVARMGGVVRVHTDDIKRAAESGFQVEVEQEPGGFIMIKLAGTLIVPAGGKLIDLKSLKNGKTN